MNYVRRIKTFSRMANELQELFDDVRESGGQPESKSYIIDFGSKERAEEGKKIVRESGILCYTSPLMNDGKSLYIPRKEVMPISLLDPFLIDDMPVNDDWNFEFKRMI